jgi:hypothetical protein
MQRPFDLAASCVVRGARGESRAIVGYTAGTRAMAFTEEPSEGREDYAGFFGRGLTLHETTGLAHVLRGLRFKLESSALSHTLSRDGIRHDKAYERELRWVRELAEELPARLADEHRVAATAAAEGAPLSRYLPGLMAAVRHLEPREVMLPLVHAIDGVPIVSLATLREQHRVLAGGGPSARTQALALRGVPVIGAHAKGSVLAVVDETLRRGLGSAVDVESLALIRPLGPEEVTHANRTLVDCVKRAMEIAEVGVQEVILARVEGGTPRPEGTTPIAYAVDTHAPPWVLETERRSRWAASAVLALDIDHEAVASARAFAERADRAVESGPRLEAIAAILARIIHLEIAGAIGRAENEALLSYAAGAEREA